MTSFNSVIHPTKRNKENRRACRFKGSGDMQTEIFERQLRILACEGRRVSVDLCYQISKSLFILHIF